MATCAHYLYKALKTINNPILFFMAFEANNDVETDEKNLEAIDRDTFFSELVEQYKMIDMREFALKKITDFESRTNKTDREIELFFRWFHSPYKKNEKEDAYLRYIQTSRRHKTSQVEILPRQEESEPRIAGCETPDSNGDPDDIVNDWDWILA